MKVGALLLENFRNYKNREFVFDLDKDITVFVGENGAGKTNILEALYLVSATQSFRAPRKENMITENADYFRAGVELFDDNGEDHVAEVYMQVLPAKVVYRWNEVKMSATGFFGKMSAVLFVPEDLNLVTDAPKRRRFFLDMLLSRISRRYLEVLSEYQKALAQRNKLLTEIRERKPSADEFEYFENIIVSRGKLILEERRQCLEYFNTFLATAYNEISGIDADVSLQYVDTVPKEREFRDALRENWKKDVATMRTNVGPHRDDFLFLLDGRQLPSVGSRGEFRTMILSLKMAELKFLAERTGKKPILLLDDVFSELDSVHRYGLLDGIRGFQTIITTVEPHYFRDFTGAHQVCEIA